MKKTYDKPEIETLDLRGYMGVLASSGDDDDEDFFPGSRGKGRENACQHGAIKWFCD